MHKLWSQKLRKSFLGGNGLEISVLFLQLPDQKKFCFHVTIFIQTTQILQSAIQYCLKKMSDKYFIIFVSYFIIFVKKEITASIWINIDVFFYKNHDGELQDMSHNYPKLIFFEEVITGHHF